MADPEISNDDIQHGGCVSDALTVVRSVSPNKPLAKVHTWETENRLRPKINRQAYSRALYVVSEQLPVGSIHDLHRALITLQGEQHKAVIRGQPAEGLDALLPHRRLAKSKTDGRTGAVTPASYQPKPRQWLAIDMDDIPNAEGHDPAVDPDGALEYLRSQLPPCFHEATCAAQWTSSQNIDVVEGGRSEPEYLGARLWFWLNRPVSDREAKDWLGEKDAKGQPIWPVDVSPYQPVGLHYTSAPIWKLGPEILPQRVTFWAGETDAVLVPEITLNVASRRTMVGDENAPRIVSSVADTMTPEAYNRAVKTIEDIWPRGPNNRHVLSLALAGYLLSRGVSEPEAFGIIRSATGAAHDEDADSRADNVTTTADAMRLGNPTTGFPKIVELIGSEAAERLSAGVSVKTTATLPLPVVDPFFPADGLISLDEAEARSQAAIDEFWSKANDHHGWADDSTAMPADSAFADIDKPTGSPPVHALAVTMGVGKTHVAIVANRQLPNGATALHSVPDHALSSELRERYCNEGMDARTVKGLFQVGDDGRDMCQHPKTMGAWINAGQAAFDLCQVCADRDGCNTEAQRASKGDAGHILTAHAYLRQPDDRRPFPKPDIAIIDESPIDALTRGVDAAITIRLDDLATWTGFEDGARGNKFKTRQDIGTSRTQDINDTMRAVHDAIQAGKFTAGELRRRGVTEGDCKLAAGGWHDRSIKLDPGAIANDFTADAIEAAAASATGDPRARRMARFFTLLGRYLRDDWPDDGAFNAFEIETVTDDDNAEFERVRMVWSDTPNLDCPTLIMDGTLNDALARRLFPGLDTITRLRVDAPHVRVVQVADTELSKQKLGALQFQSAADKKTAANHARQLLDMAESQAANQAPDGNGCRLLIVTYKAVREAIKRDHADRVESDCPQYTRLLGGIEIAHIGNIRGADRWKDTGGIIVAGRPQPTAEALERLTRAIFFDDPKQIDSIGPGGQLPMEIRGIRMRDGSGVGVEVASHPDARCRAMLDQITRAEIEQIIHRLRLVRRTADNPATVILATRTVVDITVDRVTAWRALAPNPVEMMLARGVLPNDWQTVAAVLADRFQSIDAAKALFKRSRDIQAEFDEKREAVKSCHTPFIGTKGNLTRFVPYRLTPSKGYARTGYIDIARHPDPRAAFEFWLGEGQVTAFEITTAAAEIAPPVSSGEYRPESHLRTQYAPPREGQTSAPEADDVSQYAHTRARSVPIEQQPPLPGATWIEPKAITTPPMPPREPEPEWLDLPRERTLFADVGGLPADGEPERVHLPTAVAYAETGGPLPSYLAGAFNAIVRHRLMDHDAAAREAGAGSRSHLSNARHEKYGLSPEKARNLVAWIAKHCGHDMPPTSPPPDERMTPPNDTKGTRNNGNHDSARLPARPPSNENGPSNTIGGQRLAE